MTQERQLPEHIMVATPDEKVGDVAARAPAIRSLRPRLVAVVDERGKCLSVMAAARLDGMNQAARLAECRDLWPRLLALPASQPVTPREAALYFAEELLNNPWTPGVALVDEEGRLVDVITKATMHKAAPELARLGGPDRGASLSTGGLEGATKSPFATETAVGVPRNGELKSRRYGVVDMPDQVRVGYAFELKVSIDEEAAPAAAGMIELALRSNEWPLDVIAELYLPNPEDFKVVGPTELHIMVPNRGNSKARQFRLIPQTAGAKKVQVQFTLDSLFLGIVQVETMAVDEVTVAPNRAPVDGALIIQDVGSRPDFAIWIRGQGQRYRMEVLSRGAGKHLNAEIEYPEPAPSRFMRVEYQRLNSLPGQAGSAADEVELAKTGYNLYREIFGPDALQPFHEFYWNIMRKAAEQGSRAPTLQVVSDEPSVSWELLRAYHDRGQDEYHFCERFGLVRWLSTLRAPPTVAHLAARRMVMVSPPVNLAYVEREREALQDVAQRAGLEFTVLKTLAEVRALLASGDADILHFACHGLYDDERPDSSVLRIGEEELTPRDVIGPLIGWNGKQRGEEQGRALVFLNACQSGQQGFGLTGLDGWATRFITEAGAGLFVGSTWNASDDLAAEFAPAFYRGLLLEKLPAAEALRKARRQLKDKKKQLGRPADGTHLSYTLFGDPNATVN